jgi:ArsR family transcriptional regulator
MRHSSLDYIWKAFSCSIWFTIDSIRLCGYRLTMQKEAKTFKALADGTRLRILALLLEGELCVCEIIAALELPQSTTSRHLAYLRNSDWVKDRRQGVWMYYRLNEGEHALISSLKPLLEKFLANSPEHEEALEKLRHFQKEQGPKAC